MYSIRVYCRKWSDTVSPDHLVEPRSSKIQKDNSAEHPHTRRRPPRETNVWITNNTVDWSLEKPLQWAIFGIIVTRDSMATGDRIKICSNLSNLQKIIIILWQIILLPVHRMGTAAAKSLKRWDKFNMEYSFLWGVWLLTKKTHFTNSVVSFSGVFRSWFSELSCSVMLVHLQT